MTSAICFSLNQFKILSSGNALTNDKILEEAKLKAVVDNKLNIAKMKISFFW